MADKETLYFDGFCKFEARLFCADAIPANRPHGGNNERNYFNYENSFGLQASAIFSAGKWLNGNVFAVGIYKHAKSDHFFDLPFNRKKLTAALGGTASIKLCRTQDLRLILNPFFQSKAIQGVYDISPIFRMNAKLQWTSHDGKWGLRINGSNIFNNKADTRSVQGNQDYRMKVNYN